MNVCSRARRAEGPSTILSLPTDLQEKLVAAVIQEEGGFGKVPVACRELRDVLLGTHLDYSVTYPRGLRASEAQLQEEMQSLGRVTSLTLQKGSVNSLSFKHSTRRASTPSTASRTSPGSEGSTQQLERSSGTQHVPGTPAAAGRSSEPRSQQSQAGAHSRGTSLSQNPAAAAQRPWNEHLQALSSDCVPVEFRHLSDASTVFPSLTNLRLQFTGSDTGHLPAWPGRLPGLERLYLHDWRGPSSYTDDRLSLPPTLRALHLPNLGIHHLPASLGELDRLTELRLEDLSSLRELPRSLGMLPSLQSLSISYCRKLGTLPTTFTELESLRSLRVASSGDMVIPALGVNIQSTLRSCQVICGSPASDEPASGGRILLPNDLKHCSELRALSLFGLSEDSLGGCTWLRGLSSLRTLQMNNCEVQSLPEAFSRLSKLQELHIRGPSLRELPESLATGPGPNASLQRVDICSPCLRRIPLGFRSRENLRSLKELQLGGNSKWGVPLGSEFKTSFLSRAWEHLEVLRVTLGRKLPPAGAGKNLPRLKELHFICKLDLPWRDVRSSLDGFISGLRRLQELNLVCANSRQYPTSLEVGSLRSLELGHESLAGPPKLQSSKDVWLRHTAKARDDLQPPPLAEAPLLLRGLPSLQSLGLNCKGADDLPASLFYLSSLTRLSLNPFSAAQSLPQSFTALTSISDLRIISAPHLQQLPSDMSALVKLRSLKIGSCPELRALQLPGPWPDLGSLDIWDCAQLQTLSLQPAWTQLATLSIAGCPLLEMAADSLAACPSVTVLSLPCTLLPQLASGLTSLVSLTDFTLSPNHSHLSSSHKTALPGTICGLPALRRISARTECLEELPVGLSGLRRLEQLDITSRGCKGSSNFLLCVPLPRTLPGLRFEDRRHLQRVVQRLADLDALETGWLPSSFCRLTSLTSLRLKGYLERSLPAAISQLSKLTSLTCKDCQLLESLPAEVGALPQLRSLKLRRCPRLRVAIDGTQGYSSLTTMSIIRCPFTRLGTHALDPVQ